MKKIKGRFFLGTLIFFAGIGILRTCQEAKINREKNLEKYKIEVEPPKFDEVFTPSEYLKQIDDYLDEGNKLRK